MIVYSAINKLVNALLMGFLLQVFEPRHIWDSLLLVLRSGIVVLALQHVLRGYVYVDDTFLLHYLFLF